MKNKILILSILFVFSFVLRLLSLNAMGRTWDEPAQFQDGYNFVKLIASGDFTNPYLYNHSDHPPLTKYIYGLSSFLDIESNNKSNNFFLEGEPTFKYDITHSRLVSALFSSFAVVLVGAIGLMISPFVAIVSGVIMASLPFFLGLSQLSTIESVLTFFFTGSVFSFFVLLKKKTLKWMIITGIFTGFSLLTKYTNLMLIPLYFLFYLLYLSFEQKKFKKEDYKLLLIVPISIFVFFIFWPMPFFNLPEVIEYNSKLRIANVSKSIPEVFFGKLLLVPNFYYFVMFLITTPLLTLFSFFLGSKVISDVTLKNNRLNFFKKINFSLPKNNFLNNVTPWLLLALVIWFLFPFLQSFYNLRQHGIRYIIQIYAPFSIVSAIGFTYLYSLLKKNFQKVLLSIAGIIYLFIPLVSVSPYYLDYFNLSVGGTNMVYEKRLFQLGFWGQGIKEAALYLDEHATKGSSVGLAVVPIESVPKMHSLKAEKYDPQKKYDYVLVSFFNIVRQGFDDKKIRKFCDVVYSAKAGQARLVDVYKCN